MNVFQIMALLFGLFMLYVVRIHSKKATLAKFEMWFWYSLWFLFITISIFPNFLLGIAHALHFVRVFDLLVVIAFAILSFLVLMSYFRQRENSKKLEELIRKLALNSAKKIEK